MSVTGVDEMYKDGMSVQVCGLILRVILGLWLYEDLLSANTKFLRMCGVYCALLVCVNQRFMIGGYEASM